MSTAGNPPVVSTPRRAIVIRTFVAALVVFHIGLFATHVVDGRLGNPEVALRWLAGLALLSGLVVLRRLAASRSTRRTTVALWLLVALLHGNAAATGDAQSAGSLSLPEVLATVLTGTAVGATLTALGLLLVVALRRNLRVPVRGARPMPGASRAPRFATPGFALVFSPRPPPIR